MSNEINDRHLYEGLVYSELVDAFEDHVKRWAVASSKFKVVNKQKKIQLNFSENISEKELDNLSQMITRLGWYISAYLVEGDKMEWEKFDRQSFLNDSNKKLYSFQLEAKYDRELNKRSLEILWHSTPSINDKKIQSIGLVPKSRSKISYHPERVYFATVEEDLDSISYQFYRYNQSVREFSYYEIDMKASIKLDSEIRLFEDPNFIDGVYTLSNIPKQCLKFIRKEIYE